MHRVAHEAAVVGRLVELYDYPVAGIGHADHGRGIAVALDIDLEGLECRVEDALTGILGLGGECGLTEQKEH